MNVQEQIETLICGQPEQKRADMQELHSRIQRVMPESRLWYFDGRDDAGKVVTNPTIGYGQYTITYANGTTREFFQVGLLANASGISVHILGIDDKTYLPKNFGKDLGKASVSGYCIKFKALKDINLDVLEAAIRYGLECSNAKQ